MSGFDRRKVVVGLRRVVNNVVRSEGELRKIVVEAYNRSVLDMFSIVLSIHCAFTTTMKISQRCFRAACTITAFLLRSFHDFTPMFVGHDPATLVLNMFKISVARAYSLPIMKTLPRSYCAYEDSITFLLRFVTIGHDFDHALIVVEAASMCEQGVSFKTA